jgi:hypothetical protein
MLIDINCMIMSAKLCCTGGNNTFFNDRDSLSRLCIASVASKKKFSFNFSVNIEINAEKSEQIKNRIHITKIL